PEHADLLAGRDIARRRRLLEDAAVARASSRQHGEELRAEAEHARVDERHARRHRGVVHDELGGDGVRAVENDVEATQQMGVRRESLLRSSSTCAIKKPLSSRKRGSPACEPYLSPPARAASELAPASVQDRLLWRRRAGPSATLDKAIFFSLSRSGANPKGAL